MGQTEALNAWVLSMLLCGWEHCDLEVWILEVHRWKVVKALEQRRLRVWEEEEQEERAEGEGARGGGLKVVTEATCSIFKFTASLAAYRLSKAQIAELLYAGGV